MNYIRIFNNRYAYQFYYNNWKDLFYFNHVRILEEDYSDSKREIYTNFLFLGVLQIQWYSSKKL